MELSKAIERYDALLDLYMNLEQHDEYIYRKINLYKGYIDTMNISNIADYVLDISTGIEDITGNLTLIEDNIDKMQNSMD